MNLTITGETKGELSFRKTLAFEKQFNTFFAYGSCKDFVFTQWPAMGGHRGAMAPPKISKALI